MELTLRNSNLCGHVVEVAAVNALTHPVAAFAIAFAAFNALESSLGSAFATLLMTFLPVHAGVDGALSRTCYCLVCSLLLLRSQNQYLNGTIYEP